MSDDYPLTAHCLLLTAYCLLLTTCYLLLTTSHCLLLTTCYLLPTYQTLVEIDEIAPFFSFAKRARKAEETERDRRAARHNATSLLQDSRPQWGARRPATVAPAGGNLKSWASSSSWATTHLKPWPTATPATAASGSGQARDGRGRSLSRLLSSAQWPPQEDAPPSLYPSRSRPPPRASAPAPHDGARDLSPPRESLRRLSTAISGVAYTNPFHHAERQSVADGAHSIAVQRGLTRRVLPTTPDGTLHRPRYVVQRDVQRPQSTLHAHRWSGRDDVGSRITADSTPAHHQW